MSAHADSNLGRLYQVIRKPHISEKATIVAEKHKQFVFKVADDSNKTEIKNAIEMLFNVKVDEVRTCNVKRQAHQFKQRAGFRKGWKKAYVTLQSGFDIDFTGTKGIDK